MDKDYFNTIYDKYWEKQTKVYGITTYEKYIIHEINKRNPKKVFEVGIGNGWPIGTSLKRRGIEVNGCDIAKRLVEQAQEKLNNTDGIYVGKVQEINIKEKFDVVYCVRSSWYMLDFYEVLENMTNMMKDDGYIVFDIMEKESLYYIKQLYKQFQTKFYHYIGLSVEEEWKLCFYSQYMIEYFLKKHKMKFYSFNERQITRSKDFLNTPKRIYVCKKGDIIK